MVHFLLERGANLNLTARCSAPVASSSSTVLAVARSETTNKCQDLSEGTYENIDIDDTIKEGILLSAGQGFPIIGLTKKEVFLNRLIR